MKMITFIMKNIMLRAIFQYERFLDRKEVDNIKYKFGDLGGYTTKIIHFKASFS